MIEPRPVTVRRVGFRWPTELDVVWTPTAPEFACAANSVSLMMPIIEPYFIRTVRAAAADLPPGLRDETARYLEQEGAHHREHRRFNRLLIARYPRLAAVERLIARAYRWLETTRSPAFNLAVVAASETMAYSAARWAAEHRRELFDRADDVAATLFLWHLAEEVEHKAVAHDVHWAAVGGEPGRCGRLGARLRYGAAAITALALVTAFVLLGTTVMVTAERRLHVPLAWARLIRWSVGFAFELVTNLCVSVLPGHHPSDLADPLWYELWLRQYDADTGTLPLWREAEAIA